VTFLQRPFFVELRQTLVRLVVYVGLIGAIAYFAPPLLMAGLRHALPIEGAVADLRPAITPEAPQRVHSSLPLRLRGTVED
jgi:hypothetical protein